MTYKSRKTVPQQLSGLGFVILFHIAVIYIVASGLGKTAVEKIVGPVETRVIEEAKKEVDEPPPPPPKIETPPPFVPPPDMEIAAEPTDTTSTAIKAVQSTAKAPPPTPQPSPVAEVAPRNDPRRPAAIPESAYPPQSKRLNEEGDVIVSLLIREDGTVGEVKVEKGSGYSRLDEATVEQVKKWRFLPGTREGKPAAMWITRKVAWKLKKF